MRALVVHEIELMRLQNHIYTYTFIHAINIQIPKQPERN